MSLHGQVSAILERTPATCRHCGRGLKVLTHDNLADKTLVVRVLHPKTHPTGSVSFHEYKLSEHEIFGRAGFNYLDEIVLLCSKYVSDYAHKDDFNPGDYVKWTNEILAFPYKDPGVKTTAAPSAAELQAEIARLKELLNTHSAPTPKPVCKPAPITRKIIL